MHIQYHTLRKEIFSAIYFTFFIGVRSSKETYNVRNYEYHHLVNSRYQLRYLKKIQEKTRHKILVIFRIYSKSFDILHQNSRRGNLKTLNWPGLNPGFNFWKPGLGLGLTFFQPWQCISTMINFLGVQNPKSFCRLTYSIIAISLYQAKNFIHHFLFDYIFLC